MKQYKLTVKTDNTVNEKDKYSFEKGNVFDVVTIIRNQYGESLVLKNTKDVNVQFERIN
ncbi:MULTISPECIES: hypothetical protein [Staphylococcus]|uniref:Uncharacterized protein n=1 Tax=Staphylococcus hyicus TaxID=1284 RepID=A0ACD5FNV5_STAHY|nr:MULTISPECIES: hypothetical protein [Staphylococcus]MCQ9301328.1 hypothetical protein [Staphylococcus hyicus]MDG4944757.1 hypothetical protein [Staphylococcus agnetis]MDP4462675.1 hypothetical protein [Staphylococcus hyicus]